MTYQPGGQVISTGNSSTTPLSGGATFTGSWQSCLPYVAITVKAKADVAGSIYVDFSADGGSTTLDSPQLSSAELSVVRDVIVGSSSFRVRYVNGSSAQASFTIQTLLSGDAKVALPTSRLGASLTQFSDALTVRQANDPQLDTSIGNVGGRTVVLKFGANTNVAASSTAPVTSLGTLNFLTAATTVRIKAGGSANDTAAGSGAREVTVEGLDSNFAVAQATIATNGASASSATATSFWRIYRAWVSAGGTYATTTTGANDGNIVIENSAGGTDLIQIPTGFGQTIYGAYTIPAGYTGYLTDYQITVTSAKASDISLYQRQNADDTSAPVSAKRIVVYEPGVLGSIERNPLVFRSFPAKTDLWWMATTGSGAASSVSVTYSIILVAT